MLRRSHCLALLPGLALAASANAAMFDLDFTTGTDGNLIPGWTNTVAADDVVYREFGSDGVTLSSTNNGLNTSYQDFAGFETGVVSFSMDYVLRTGSGDIQFGVGSQTDLNGGAYSNLDPLLAVSIKNVDLVIQRPNAAGDGVETTANLFDPPNNQLVSVRLEVDVINGVFDVFADAGSGGATTQVANDLALNWSGLVTSTDLVDRYWTRTRTSAGLSTLSIVTVVPEPGSLALLAAGIFCLMPRHRRG